MGHPLVMGRKTLESIGRALPGRRSIVITRQPHWTPPASRPRTRCPRRCRGPGPGDEVFVVGGGEVYAEAMPFAQRMVLTEVDRVPRGRHLVPRVGPQPVARGVPGAARGLRDRHLRAGVTRTSGWAGAAQAS